MNSNLAARRELLRKKYHSVVGRPFDHFCCPMLYTDEPVELCQAHVVNRAFENSSSVWTVQRKDIDNFYGAMFEGKFLNLRFREHGIAIRAMLDPALYRRLRPRLLLNGLQIPYFVSKGPVPKGVAKLQLESDTARVLLGLKLPPGVEVCEESQLEFEVDHDFRLAAIVSVLKAAHLTAFHLLDYSYALGPGGMWLGRRLGEFYLQNHHKSREDVLLAAIEYFRDLTALVRPVSAAPPAISGTVDDQWIHFCWHEEGDDRRPWALLIYIRTEEQLHAALVPVFEHETGAARFSQFLESGGDSFDISIAKLENDHWSVDPHRHRVHWPPASLD